MKNSTAFKPTTLDLYLENIWFLKMDGKNVNTEFQLIYFVLFKNII